MLVLKLINKSKNTVDISCYRGNRVVMLPSSIIRLKETYSEGLKNYYRQLNTVGVYLLKEYTEDSTEEARIEPLGKGRSVEPLNSGILDGVEASGEFREALEVSGSQGVSIEASKGPSHSKGASEVYSFAGLMSMRHIDLIKLANNLGYVVNEEMSKRTLSKMILGGK